MSFRPLALACALAAAAGCGESRNEEIRDEQRAICLGFPANGTTLRGATEALGRLLGPTQCLPGEDTDAEPRFRRFDNDVCDHTVMSLCHFGWCRYVNDPALCGPNGCWYGCQVRVIPKDDDQDDRIDDDAVICASRFASEEPVPPFCPF